MSVPVFVTLPILAVSAIAVLAPAVVLARASAVGRGLGIRVSAGLGAWFIATALVAASGGYATTLAAVVPSIGVALSLALVGFGLAVASSARLQAALRDPTVQARLLGLQVWRIVGGVFLVLFALGQLPALFALPAGLGDVFVGLAAPLVARNMRRRGLVVAWNLLGLADLALAIFLGTTTNPGRLGLFVTTPPSELLTGFPLAIVPTFLVPLSIGMHLVSLRYQLSQQESRARLGSALAAS